MRRVILLLFACSSYGIPADKKLDPKDVANQTVAAAPAAFAQASAQAASLRKQREAVERQRAAMGVPESDNPFFFLPSAFHTPADSSFFILSGK